MDAVDEIASYTVRNLVHEMGLLRLQQCQDKKAATNQLGSSPKSSSMLSSLTRETKQVPAKPRPMDAGLSADSQRAHV